MASYRKGLIQTGQGIYIGSADSNTIKTMSLVAADAGLMIWNTDTSSLWIYNGSQWSSVLSSVPTPSPAGNYTVTDFDHIILKSGISPGGDAVTLPVSPPIGREYVIKDASGTAGTNNLTVDTAGPLIDGDPFVVLTADYASITVIFDGTNYYII